MDPLAEEFARVTGLCRKENWRGVEETTSYGTPALKVDGKFMLRIREPGVLVIRCDMDEKEFLMQAAPDTYFETPHYKGWPGLLIRLPNIGDDELTDRLERAWKLLAKKRWVDERRASGKEHAGDSEGVSP